MSFKSFLSQVGADTEKVFNWIGSTQGQSTIAAVEGTAEVVTTAVNPGIGLALTGIIVLVNKGLQNIVQMEASAAAVGAQAGTGPQKAAAVAASLTPQIPKLLQDIGISAPTVEQVNTVATAVTNGLVAILNAIPPGA